MSLAKALSIQPRRRRPGMTEKKVDWDVNYHYKQTGCKVNWLDVDWGVEHYKQTQQKLSNIALINVS